MASRQQQQQQQQDRSKLEQDLAALLNYDIDEISDILDNILQSFSIDTSTKDDLLEHMMAWLGGGGSDTSGNSGNDGDGELGLLVENIIRFQKKESLIERGEDPNSAAVQEKKTTTGVTSGGGDSTTTSSSMKSKKQQERANREIQQKELQRQKEEKRKKEKEDLRRKEIEDRQRRLEQQVQLKNLEQNDQQKKKKKKQQQQGTTTKQSRSQKEQEKKQEEEEMMVLERVKALSLQESNTQNNSNSIGGSSQVVKKSTNTKIRGKKQVQKNVTTKQRPVPPPPPPPPIGKAKFVCGCFGTKYKPVTNCLHCGRIICEREWKGSGPIYCPHCNNLVEKVTMPEEELEKLLSEAKTDEREELKKAILNKQRLLQFDRENTKRTAVFDDQADYYQNSTSNWLTEEERAEAKEQDDKERRELHNRKNPVMKLML